MLSRAFFHSLPLLKGPEIWFNTRLPFGNRRAALTLALKLSKNFRQRFDLMAKSKKKLEVVFLVCDETGDYNYTLRRKSGGEKLKLSKYSPRLRKHTMHTEKKK